MKPQSDRWTEVVRPVSCSVSTHLYDQTPTVDAVSSTLATQDASEENICEEAIYGTPPILAAAFGCREGRAMTDDQTASR